jgi:hypothetical protein
MSLGNIRGAAVPLAPPASKMAASEGIETGQAGDRDIDLGGRCGGLLTHMA